MIAIKTTETGEKVFDNWGMVYWFMDQMSDYVRGLAFPKSSRVLTREESQIERDISYLLWRDKRACGAI
jgi:hypothetical protein